MQGDIPHVGAPDPELNTSPILDDEEDETLDPELGPGVCFYNDISFPIGQYVRTGDELLKCVGRGVWLRQLEIEP